MKTRLIILVMLIVCFSCRTNNKPVSDAQKEKIKAEIKQVADRMFQGCEEANSEMAGESFLDSPDFVFLINGYALNFKESMDAINPVFESLLSQKVTIVKEKYAILDKTTVLYTANTKFLENFKDGHSELNDPTVIFCVFKKIENKWKIIYAVESYISQGVVGSEKTKELDQVELFKQFLGTWKCEVAKDTIGTAVTTSFGNNGGLAQSWKVIPQGKIWTDVKNIWGYDRKIDKYIVAQLSKDSPDIILEVFWFTSKNICEMVGYEHISNPAQAPSRNIFEFKSPDLLIETCYQNNNVIATYTYTKQKVID